MHSKRRFSPNITSLYDPTLQTPSRTYPILKLICCAKSRKICSPPALILPDENENEKISESHIHTPSLSLVWFATAPKPHRN